MEKTEGMMLKKSNNPQYWNICKGWSQILHCQANEVCFQLELEAVKQILLNEKINFWSVFRISVNQNFWPIILTSRTYLYLTQNLIKKPLNYHCTR